MHLHYVNSSPHTEEGIALITEGKSRDLLESKGHQDFIVQSGDKDIQWQGQQWGPSLTVCVTGGRQQTLVLQACQHGKAPIA